MEHSMKTKSLISKTGIVFDLQWAYLEFWSIKRFKPGSHLLQQIAKVQRNSLTS